MRHSSIHFFLSLFDQLATTATDVSSPPSNARLPPITSSTYAMMRPRLCSSPTVLQHPLIPTSRILMISHPRHGPSCALINRPLAPTESLARKASSPSPVFPRSRSNPSAPIPLLAGPVLYVPPTSEQAQVSLTFPPPTAASSSSLRILLLPDQLQRFRQPTT